MSGGAPGGRWDALAPWASPPLRLAVGLVFLHHGILKLHAGVGGIAGMLGHLGFPVPGAWAVILIAAETLGAAGVVVGLFTRFFAACLAVDMLVAISLVVLPNHHAPELEGLLLAGSLALVLLGDGPVSVGALLRLRKK